MESLFPHVALAMKRRGSGPQWLDKSLVVADNMFLLSELGAVFPTWRYFLDLHRKAQGKEISGPNTTLMHALVERNLLGLVRVHVERNDADVDPPGDYFVTPLQIAAKCGHKTWLNCCSISRPR